MSIATYSDSLKIFNYDESCSLSASSQLSDSAGVFGRITWSGDSHWIAVAPVKQGSCPLPIFKYRDNELIPMRYVTLNSITSASFFNWTNRDIAVGVETGQLYIWNIKDKKVIQCVNVYPKKSVDHLTFSSDDNMLACGSLTSNEISVFSFKTNKIVQSINIPRSEHTSGLSFCICKKSYLAASSYESTVCVWDVTKSAIVFKSFNSHAGSCTDVSFSPINFSVLASVGLTKQLKLFDLREKRTILEVTTSIGMHSVDMIAGGDKVLVGGSNGFVIIYDLRANKVYSEFKVHEGPVLSAKMGTMRCPQTFETMELNTPDTVETQSKTLDLSLMDLFSPISRKPQNITTNSVKVESFHSTPRVLSQENESAALYDSFLSKLLSPKCDNVHMSTPEQLPVNENKNYTTSSSKLGTVEEEPVGQSESSLKSSVQDNEVIGDGLHVDPPSESVLQNFLLEIRKIHKEQQESIRQLSEKVSSIEEELKVMRLDNEGKYQILQENYENLLDYLINGIKQEVYNGNCDGKLEHISQRYLIKNLSNVVCEKLDGVHSEINQYVQNINSVLKTIGNIQK